MVEGARLPAYYKRKLPVCHRCGKNEIFGLVTPAGGAEDIDPVIYERSLGLEPRELLARDAIVRLGLLGGDCIVSVRYVDIKANVLSTAAQRIVRHFIESDVWGCGPRAAIVVGIAAVVPGHGIPDFSSRVSIRI